MQSSLKQMRYDKKVETFGSNLFSQLHLCQISFLPGFLCYPSSNEKTSSATSNILLKETLPVLMEALALFKLIIYQINVGVNLISNARAMRKKLLWLLQNSTLQILMFRIWFLYRWFCLQLIPWRKYN